MNLCFSLHDTIEQHRSVFAHQDWCKHLVRVETVLCNEMQWMNSFVFSLVLPHFPDGHRLKISFFSLFLYRWAFRARNGAEINSQTPDMMLKIKVKQQLNPRMSFQWGTRSRTRRTLWQQTLLSDLTLVLFQLFLPVMWCCGVGFLFVFVFFCTCSSFICIVTHQCGVKWGENLNQILAEVWSNVFPGLLLWD